MPRGRPKSKASEIAPTAVITAEDKKKDDFQPKQRDSDAMYKYMKELKIRHELATVATAKDLIPQKTELQEMIEAELIKINQLMWYAKQYHKAVTDVSYTGFKTDGSTQINATPATAKGIIVSAYQQLSVLQNEYKVEDPYELATEIATLKYREHKQKLLSDISSNIKVPT
jgi:hypothetical protein